MHGTYTGTKSTQILNLVYSYTKFAAAAASHARARAACTRVSVQIYETQRASYSNIVVQAYLFT